MELTPTQQLEKVIVRLCLTPGNQFWGDLAIKFTLPGRMIEDPGCRSAWTNGKTLGFNPDYMMSKIEDEQTYIMAHEALHPGLLHHLRRGSREGPLWNVSGDYEINYILDTAKVGKGPPERLRLKDFDGKTAEEIYPILYKAREEQRKRKAEQPQDDSLMDDEDDDAEESSGGGGGDGEQEDFDDDADQGDGDDEEQEDTPREDDYEDRPEGDFNDEIPDLTELNDDSDIGGTGQVRDAVDPDSGQGLSQEQKDQLERDYKITIAQAAQAAKARGQLPAGIERMIKDLIQPELNWKELLGIWLAEHCAKSDYSFIPPNKRFVWQGLYLPTLVSDGEQHVVIAIDSSASIDDDLLERASVETCSVLEYWNIILHVVFCDAAIQGEPETFTKQDYPITLKPKGGGGTDFEPVFDWIAEQEQDWKPVGLVYITDLEGHFPDAPPDYPVMWLCHREPNEYYKKYCSFGDIVVMDEK